MQTDSRPSATSYASAIFLAFAAIFTLCNLSGSASADEPRVVENTSVPEQFLGFTIREVVKNEPRLGSSIFYKGPPGYLLTVFVYNPYSPDEGQFPQDFNDKAAREHFYLVEEDVFRAQAAGSYKDVKLIEQFSLVDKDKKPTFLCAEFTLVRVKENMPTRSLACLGIASGNYFKVRISTEVLDRDDPLPEQILQYLGHVAGL